MKLFVIISFVAFAATTVLNSVSEGSLAPDPVIAKKGKTVFEMRACTGCHTIGEGDRSGPDLKGLFERRPVEWVRKWLKDPEAMFEANDPAAKQMLAKFMTKMPNLGLTDEEVESAMHHIANEGAKPAKAAKKLTTTRR